jgi:hypothetical protein
MSESSEEMIRMMEGANGEWMGRNSLGGVYVRILSSRQAWNVFSM